MIRLLLVLLLLSTFRFSVFAQTDIDWSDLKFKNDSINQTHEYRITTKDGAVFYGELVGLKRNQLFIHSQELGTLSIDIKKLESIQPKKHLTNQEEHTMVGNNHYLITPSPYGLEKGEFNFQNSEIFLFSSWYGVSENVTLGGGFTLIPGIDFSEQLFYFMPKFSLPVSPKFRVSAQVSHFFGRDVENTTLLTLNTGFGEIDKHFSLGYTFPLSSGDSGALNLGTVLRVSKKFAFLADGYLLSDGEDDNLIGFGGRIIGKSSSFDFGFITVPIWSGNTVLPWFNYTLRL